MVTPASSRVHFEESKVPDKQARAQAVEKESGCCGGTNEAIAASASSALAGVTTVHEPINGVRRTLGFFRSVSKAKDTKAFSHIGNNLYLFFERYPSVIKILRVCQIFSLLGIIAQLPKL